MFRKILLKLTIIRFKLRILWNSLLGRDITYDRLMVQVFQARTLHEAKLAFTHLYLHAFGLRLTKPGEEETDDFYLSKDQLICKSQVRQFGGVRLI